MDTPKHPAEAPPAARERLLAAALQVLLARGYAGASTREMSRVAQVNQVTLFRLFSTKDDLLAAALVRHAAAAREATPAPTGVLEADLVALAERLVGDRVMGGNVLVRLLMEIRHLPEKQQALVLAEMTAMHEAVELMFRHYQEAGDLGPAPAGRLWDEFSGPIFLAVLRADLHHQPLQFDPQEHVQRFLAGCRAPQPA